MTTATLSFTKLTENEEKVWRTIATLHQTQQTVTIEDVAHSAKMGKALLCMVLGGLTYKGYIQGQHDRERNVFTFRLFVWPIETVRIWQPAKPCGACEESLTAYGMLPTYCPYCGADRSGK